MSEREVGTQGIYFQAFFVFGFNVGFPKEGGISAGFYTQVGAGVAGAGGVSYTYGPKGHEFAPIVAVGVGTPTAAPGPAASLLYDMKSGKVTFSGGAGINDFLEGGAYAEFESWDAFKDWYLTQYGRLPFSNPFEPENKKPEDEERDPPNPDDDEDPQDPGSWLPPMPQVSSDPLVLDLNRDGIKLTSVKTSRAHFDFDKDGFREKTGWLSAQDGFLFADKDKNGVASGIDELFGSASEDGFVALAKLDSNKDKVIDARDAVFEKLKIWRDANGDGISTSDEISTLADHGIASIGLEHKTAPLMLEGNELR